MLHFEILMKTSNRSTINATYLNPEAFVEKKTVEQTSSALENTGKKGKYELRNSTLEQRLRDQVSPLKKSRKTKSYSPPHTGVSINGVNFQPKDDPLLRRFVEETLQNCNYDSHELLKVRAENFFKYIKSEEAINLAAKNDMNNVESPVARQSAHMAHLIRGVWTIAQLEPHIREQLRKEIIGQDSGVENKLLDGKEKIFEAAKELYAMIINKEEGPLTREQSQYGAELAASSVDLAEKLKPYSETFSNLDKYAATNKVRSNRLGSARAPHGMDLSKDLASKIRDEMGLPVMLGTSGTASEITSAVKFSASTQNVPMWASGLKKEQGKNALIDAVHYFMRDQVAPIAMQLLYNKIRVQYGAEPKTADLSKTFVHSYPEISTAIDMTVASKKQDDKAAIVKSSKRALQRLESIRAKEKTELQAKERQQCQ